MTAYPHRYGVHGVTIRANRAIGGLRSPIEGAPEVTIDFDESGVPAPATHRPVSVIGRETVWHLDESRWLLRYESPFDARDAWTATVEAARMTVRWSPALPLADISTALQGSCLASLLLLRDVPLLHAAAIDVGGEAIAIVGDPGAGKSTTAAAFIGRGCPLLADDATALDIRDGRVFAYPGVPRLRIHADTAGALGWAATELPTVFVWDVNGRKVFIDAASESAEPLPLRAIHLLRARERERRETSITRIPPRVAIGELLRQAHAGPYLDAARMARLFASVSRVSACVPVFEVRAVDGLETLDRLVDALAAAR